MDDFEERLRVFHALRAKLGAALVTAVDRILLHQWDPIGVADVPAAAGEYHSYAGAAIGAALRAGMAEAVEEFLITVERDWMGFDVAKTPPDHLARRRAAAEAILAKVREFEARHPSAST